MLAAAKNELEHHRTGEHHIRSQIETAMTGGDKLGLPMDIDGATELVAKLRRRKEVDERLTEAREQAAELQEQGQELLGEQVIPIGAVQLAAGAVCAWLRARGAVVFGAAIDTRAEWLVAGGGWCRRIASSRGFSNTSSRNRRPSGWTLASGN